MTQVRLKSMGVRVEVGSHSSSGWTIHSERVILSVHVLIITMEVLLNSVVSHRLQILTQIWSSHSHIGQLLLKAHASLLLSVVKGVVERTALIERRVEAYSW